MLPGALIVQQIQQARRSDEQCVRGRLTKLTVDYVQVLVLLLRLRQCCGHPALITKDFDTDSLDRDAIKTAKEEEEAPDDLDDLTAALGGVDLGPKQKRCSACDDPIDAGDVCGQCRDRLAAFEGMVTSTKISEMMKILDRTPSGVKTIVFSQFVGMLDICAAFCKARGIKFVRYQVRESAVSAADRQGNMSADARIEALTKIRTRTSYTVILCSLKVRDHSSDLAESTVRRAWPQLDELLASQCVLGS